MIFDSNYPAAAQAYQIAHLLDPGNEFVVCSLADTWSYISRDRDAIPLFKHIRERAPHDPIAARYLARYLLRQDANLEAIRVIETAMGVKPSHNQSTSGAKPVDWTLHQLLGSAYSTAGYTDRAEKEYATAAQLANQYSSHLLTASRFGWRREMTKQEDALKAASKVAPDDPQWCVNLANCLKFQKRTREAKEYYEQALRCRRLIAKPYFSYATYLIEQKHLDEAKNCLAQMEKVLPWHEQTLLLRAAILASEHNEDQTERYYESLIALHPYSTVGYNSAADFFMRHRDIPHALSILKRCLRQLPSCASAWRRLGDVYCLQLAPDWAQAMKCYSRAISLMPPYSPDLNELARNDWSQVFSGMGTCYYQTGKRDEALKYAVLFNGAKFVPDLPWYFKVIQIRPGKIAVDTSTSKEQQLAQHVVLGDMLRQRHQLPQCIDEFRKAVEMDPQDVNLHCYLLEALTESGDWIAAAREDLETSNRIVAKLPAEVGKAFSKSDKKEASQPASSPTGLPAMQPLPESSQPPKHEPSSE
jgi:tetratricopeptide (TPR) repeat protein